jgi:fucose 4-O-acetylase-like acetyltransferase
MGPSIVAAGALWALFEGRRARCVAFAAATAMIAFTSPVVRATAALDFLPETLENYLRPPRASGWFSVFPWTGFVFAGAIPGVLLNHVQSREDESRLNVWLAVAGGAIAVAAYVASFLPSVVGDSDFWGGSPSFFFIRTGILTGTIPFAYVWHRAIVHHAWSPMQQLGRTSLFIYWIHVELVYGLISLKIHKSMTHPQAWAAFAAFAVLMLGCSVEKDRIVQRFYASKGSRRTAAAGSST